MAVFRTEQSNYPLQDSDGIPTLDKTQVSDLRSQGYEFGLAGQDLSGCAGSSQWRNHPKSWYDRAGCYALVNLIARSKLNEHMTLQANGKNLTMTRTWCCTSNAHLRFV